jgi:hypothetical protein
MTDTTTTSSDDNIEPLVKFTEAARNRGVEYGMIRQLLLSAGWKDAKIAKAFTAGLETPIPEVSQKRGAIEAFYHLSAFTCLYIAVVSLLVMLFELLDLALPDAAESYYSPESSLSSIRFSLSTVIVFSPLYVVFSRLIHQQAQRGELIQGGIVQRWLTYLSLFVIVITVLFDAATLVFALLEGELTTRIVIKGTTLLSVVGSVFAYLWLETKRWYRNPKHYPRVGLRQP